MATISAYKIAALQKDSAEYTFPQEIDLSVENVYSSSNLYGKQNLVDILDYLKNNTAQSFLVFQRIGQFNGSTYLFYGADQGGDGTRRPSGDGSTGYRWSASAPGVVPFDGLIKGIALGVTGVAVDTGSPAAIVKVNFEVWEVGFNGEGTKIADIYVEIPSASYTIGTYWNSSLLTAFSGVNSALNISMSAGKLLALKFVGKTGSGNAIQVQNVTATLNMVKS